VQESAADLAQVCAMVRRGNRGEAAAYLRTTCAPGVLPPSPRKQQAGVRPMRLPRPEGGSTERKYSKSQATRVFQRDGFCDRYAGGLIFPGVLRVLSDLFPAEFPWHPNWKIGAAHHLYWLLAATIDHVVPVTYQGPDTDANWVTTSMLRNLWKSNCSLEEMEWQLVPVDPVLRWDGLTGWFIWYADEHPEALRRSYVRQWYEAAKSARVAT
jgi:hypothetical protein